MCNHKVSDIWSTIIVKWILENKIFFFKLCIALLNMAFAAHLQENAISVAQAGGGDICTLFKPHCGVFVWTTRPHHGAFAAAPEKNDMYALQMPGGWGDGYAWNWLSQ